MIHEEENTAEDSSVNNENKEKRGLFKFAPGQELTSGAATTDGSSEKPKIVFSFPSKYAADSTKPEEEAKNGSQPSVSESQTSINTSFIKCMKLNDEKKYFVNKNLFDNTAIQPLKPTTFNFNFNTVNKDNKENEEVVRISSNTTEGKDFYRNPFKNLVEANPLSSTEALKQLKESTQPPHDSPVVKSLFDFSENHKYKKEDEKEPPKPEFKFDTKALFGTPKTKERGITFKPIFGTSSTNLFSTVPGSTSLIFTTGKSLFNTSNVHPDGYKPQEASPKDEDGDDEEDKLEPENKEKIEANNMFEKLFQKQVEKIKILKGISNPEKKPSKKDLGYLSIEKMKD